MVGSGDVGELDRAVHRGWEEVGGVGEEGQAEEGEEFGDSM